jgi:hypothetical protein
MQENNSLDSIIDDSFIELMKKFDDNKELDQVYLLYGSLYLLNTKNEKYHSLAIDIIQKLRNKKKDAIAELSTFLYGFYTLIHKGKESADIIWHDFLYDPLFHNSPFKSLVIKARNWEFDSLILPSL